MVATQSQQPFDLLRELEQRSRSRAMGLPQQVEVRRTWSGIGFSVGGLNLVSDLDEVDEILDYPTMTRVPGAHNWVRGLANIRGTLLPILDLSGLIDDRVSQPSRSTRVLVVHEGDLSAGLVVDEVVGMRHFFDEDFTRELPDASDSMRGFLKGAYRQGDNLWAVFSMQKLRESDQFVQVASHS